MSISSVDMEQAHRMGRRRSHESILHADPPAMPRMSEEAWNLSHHLTKGVADELWFPLQAQVTGWWDGGPRAAARGHAKAQPPRFRTMEEYALSLGFDSVATMVDGARKKDLREMEDTRVAAEASLGEVALALGLRPSRILRLHRQAIHVVNLNGRQLGVWR